MRKSGVIQEEDQVWIEVSWRLVKEACRYDLQPPCLLLQDADWLRPPLSARPNIKSRLLQTLLCFFSPCSPLFQPSQTLLGHLTDQVCPALIAASRNRNPPSPAAFQSTPNEERSPTLCQAFQLTSHQPAVTCPLSTFVSLLHLVCRRVSCPLDTKHWL